MAKALWIVAGALFGFSLIALASIGVFILPLALGEAAVLTFLKVRGAWLFVVAAGATFALAWLRLVLDPNAPDDSLVPVVVGAVVALAGWFLHRRSSRAGAGTG